MDYELCLLVTMCVDANFDDDGERTKMTSSSLLYIVAGIASDDVEGPLFCNIRP